MNNDTTRLIDGREEVDSHRRYLKELELLLQIAVSAQVIGGTADALRREYPAGNPGWELSECIRREAAALKQVTDKAIIGW